MKPCGRPWPAAAPHTWRRTSPSPRRGGAAPPSSRRARTAGAAPNMTPDRPAVLALGIFLADRDHAAEAIAAELARSRDWTVEQHWAALGAGPVPPGLTAVSVERVVSPVPKFILLNRLL